MYYLRSCTSRSRGNCVNGKNVKSSFFSILFFICWFIIHVIHLSAPATRFRAYTSRRRPSFRLWLSGLWPVIFVQGESIPARRILSSEWSISYCDSINTFNQFCFVDLICGHQHSLFLDLIVQFIAFLDFLVKQPEAFLGVFEPPVELRIVLGNFLNRLLDALLLFGRQTTGRPSNQVCNPRAIGLLNRCAICKLK